MTNQSASTKADPKTSAGEASKNADRSASDPKGQKGNGNNFDPQPDAKSGGAEKGGPGLDKAKSRQPPGATN